MSQAPDLLPPIDANVEYENIAFDYGLVLNSGVIITTVALMSCTVETGPDPTPAARLIGSPVVIPSRVTGAPAQAVMQAIGNMVAGTTYLLQCVAATSDGQQLSVWTHRACIAPG